MALMRELLGTVLRSIRLERQLTLREVSARSRISLGYVSEIERGHKEASSELLAALASALEVPLWRVLREVSDQLAYVEGDVIENDEVTSLPTPQASAVAAA